MSKLKVQQPIIHLPAFTEYSISLPDLNALLLKAGIAQIYLWDWTFWYVNLEDWGRVFADVLLNMPKYTTEKFDCENFALLTSARVSSIYQLNTCGVAIGESPFGEHGYNLFVARVDNETKLFILEPQNGMIYPIEQSESYKPRLVFIG